MINYMFKKCCLFLYTEFDNMSDKACWTYRVIMSDLNEKMYVFIFFKFPQIPPSRESLAKITQPLKFET